MSNTPAQNVFDALQSAPNYHPASARLFTDWLVQAGDVVTVSSGNDSYNLPIFNMEMVWKGSPMVEVDCTGKEKRDPPSALQRRSYGASRTQSELDGIHTQLLQDEDKIGLVVTETSGGNVVNTASIIAAINGGTGHSSVAIEADSVLVTGTTIRVGDVVKTYQNVRLVETDFLTASLAQTSVLQIGTGGTASTWQTVTPDSVSDVQVVLDNNVYKLQKKTWGNQNWQDAGTTFSRATTLTGTWSGGTYTVTASPQGSQESTVVILVPDGNGTSDNFSVKVYHDDTLSASNVILSEYIYLTDDTTNNRIQARWGSASGTVYAQKSYSGGTPVTLNEPTWGSVTTATSNTYTVSASNGESKSQMVSLSQSNWSGGSKTVYMSAAGNYVARTSVSIPSISESVSNTGSSTQISDRDSNVSISGNYHYYALTVSVGGKTKKVQITQLNNY